MKFWSFINLGVPRCPTKNLGPIGSGVLTFIRYKQTDRQTDKEPNRQAKFIYRWKTNIRYFHKSFIHEQIVFSLRQKLRIAWYLLILLWNFSSLGGAGLSLHRNFAQFVKICAPEIEVKRKCSVQIQKKSFLKFKTILPILCVKYYYFKLKKNWVISDSELICLNHSLHFAKLTLFTYFFRIMIYVLFYSKK